MDSKIRTAIFGAGFGKYGHFDALETLRQFEVVAVCGSRYPKDLNVKVYSSDDWQKVLDENSFDLAVIAVPPQRQTQILLAAMKKRLAVMVEKPLCLNQTEFNQIEAQYQQTQNFSAASFIFPELETWKTAKKLIEQQELGSLRSIAVDWRVESPAIKNKLQSWKSTTQKGGSALFHFLPHMIHALNFFAGPIESLSCVSSPAVDLGAEFGSPICLIQMVLKSKVVVSMNCSLAAPCGAGHTLEFNGSKGTLVLENKGTDYVKGFKLKMQNEEKTLEIFEKDMNPHLGNLDSRTAPLISIYKKFAEAFEDRKPISPSIQEAIDTQNLILLCEASSEKKQWLKV